MGVRRAPTLTLRQPCCEHMQKRLHSIAQDMYILTRSCGEEVVRSSLARARKTAPKTRRLALRKRVRPVKQARSDTIEESISSTDEVAPQRKRATVYKGSPPSATTHIAFNTSCHHNITISHSNKSTSHRTIFHRLWHRFLVCCRQSSTRSK